MILSPANLGADVVIHSLTKFINGTSDTVAGVICGTHAFIQELSDVNKGMVMLLGPVMDSLRSASVLKNLHSLHLRMQQHSNNALYLATKIAALGIRIQYPGLAQHAQYTLLESLKNEKMGSGGMMVLNMGSKEKAYLLMEKMQKANIGYLAVSLGYYKTLFSSPGSSTSSEIPEEERLRMGLSDGLVRISVGLDASIEETYAKMKACLTEVLEPVSA